MRFRLMVVSCALLMGACDGAPASRPAGDASTDVALGDTSAADGLRRDVGSKPDSARDAAVDTSVVADSAAVSGTWANPINIGALPFSHSGNTTNAPADDADTYSCAPGTDESGGEVVYSLTLPTETKVTLSVDDTPGDAVDVDVHLLSGLSPTLCVQRDNISITATLAAGTHVIVVDTWVDGGGVEKAGAYTLQVRKTGTSPPPTGCLKNPLPSCQAGSYPTPNGTPTEAPGDPGCPAGMAKVDTFCIDRYEAMLVEVNAGGALAPFSPYRNPGSTTVRALSVAGAVPQGYITQVQAAQACANAGKRLCTDVEWLRACQGAAKQTYPYGTTRQPGVCNDARSCHPVVQYFESSANWIWSRLDHPCINQLPQGLAKTGAHSGCVTGKGVFDMMGNLHEWTAASSGIFRGGFYVDTKINGNGCLYRTTAHNTSHWDYSTGFRCCAQ